jgi:hypothetical protein
MMLRIDIHRWFAMAAILNPKWPPKYKNPPIWPKFGFQVDYDVVIFIVGLLWCLELDETFQKFCLTCVHIILRLRNFRMAAIATKNVENLKCSELDET